MKLKSTNQALINRDHYIVHGMVDWGTRVTLAPKLCSQAPLSEVQSTVVCQEGGREGQSPPGRQVKGHGKDVFPSLQAALRILLTIAVSVASCERSFSKLKLIKTHLRTSMNQERLTNLAIMSIERRKCQKCNLTSKAETFFNTKKSRQDMG